jgi:hypothetical protein
MPPSETNATAAWRGPVVLGPIEIAGVCSALAKGLRARGHRAEVVVVRRNWLGYPYDRLVDAIPARLAFALSAPVRYRVFHYHFGYTWWLFADAVWARTWGRLRLMHYHGDDCRLARVALREHPWRGRVTDPRNDRARVRRLRVAARCCAAAVVGDLELLSYVRPFFSRIYLLPLCVDLTPPPSPRQRRDGEPPLVLHAASDPAIKGTREVRRVVDAVARTIALRSRIIAGRPHAEVVSAIAEADVVVDQLNSETYGVFAVEAMGQGKPVLAELNRAKLAPWARSVPIVDSSPETLARRLEELLRDDLARERLGTRGAAFARNVHAPERVAAAAEHLYGHLSGQPPPGVYAATPEGVTAFEETA